MVLWKATAAILLLFPASRIVLGQGRGDGQPGAPAPAPKCEGGARVAQAVGACAPPPLPPPLRFTADGTFKILLFTDLHLGEGEDTDRRSLEVRCGGGIDGAAHKRRALTQSGSGLRRVGGGAQ